MDGTDNIKRRVKEQVVSCRKLKFHPLIPLEDCKKCKDHRGIVSIVPVQNNAPAVSEAVCGLPVRIRIQPVVEVE